MAFDVLQTATRDVPLAGERSSSAGLPHGRRLILHDLAKVGFCTRVIAQVAGCALVGALRVVAVLAGVLGRCLAWRRVPGPSRIVLTGMFVSDGWVEAHVRPLALSDACGRIWVVTDRPMLSLPKTTYVCPPRRLQRVMGRAPSRSLYCVLTALRERADVIGGFHLIFNGMVALIAARLLRARSVFFCVGGYGEIWGGGARSETRLFHKMGRDVPWLERQLLWFVRRMDMTLTMGTGCREFLRQRGVSGPIAIMSGGIDASRFVASKDDANREFDLIFVGRLVPIKRPDILLQVVACVATRKPDLRVAIVGDGPLRADMEEAADRLGIRKNLLFVGHQSNVVPWLKKSRVFVLTSDSEGLALSVLEAMMAGLPAVVSDVGDLGDIVVDGLNGWRPARRDVKQFADRIVELLSDEDTYRSFSAAACRAAMVYSLESARARWDGILPV